MFGLREGINEVIGVTFGVSERNGRNTAPLGLIVKNGYYLRLFGETHTLRNLKANSKLYANVTFNPLAFAISAFEDLPDEYFADEYTLKDSYSVCIFKPRRFEKREEFTLCELELIDGKIVNPHAVRAFNRAFAAVIEAAIMLTRGITDLRELESLVKRCGGKEEREAFEYLLTRARSINSKH